MKRFRIIASHYYKYEYISGKFGKVENLSKWMNNLFEKSLDSYGKPDFNKNCLLLIKAIKTLRKQQGSFIPNFTREIGIIENNWQHLDIIEPNKCNYVWIKFFNGDILLCYFHDLKNIRVVEKSNKDFDTLKVGDNELKANEDIKWQYFK